MGNLNRKRPNRSITSFWCAALAIGLGLAVTGVPASAATLNTLVNFTGNSGNGRSPYAGLTMDSAGNLYGTTIFGGSHGRGTVFKFAGGATANPGAVTDLAVFRSSQDGQNPYAGLTIDAAGNLYGAAASGGVSDVIGGNLVTYGLVFKIPGGATANPAPISKLASFNNASVNGKNPYGTLIADASGNLYGTTNEGGASGLGTVFKIVGGATETPGALVTLATFNGSSNGRNPQGMLTIDDAGNIYGTTDRGGTDDLGTVFKIAGGATASPGTLTTLAMFSGTNGSRPISGGIVIDDEGNLYGTTREGGGSDFGTVYKIDGGATSTPGSLTTVVTFDGTNGRQPQSALITDAAGNLYGTTVRGGANDAGTIFKIAASTDTTPAALTTLVSLTTASGSNPYGTLISDSAGNLYGTALNGGSSNFGTIFRVSESGFVVVPEPAALSLLVSTGLLAMRRRRSAPCCQ